MFCERIGTTHRHIPGRTMGAESSGVRVSSGLLIGLYLASAAVIFVLGTLDPTTTGSAALNLAVYHTYREDLTTEGNDDIYPGPLSERIGSWMVTNVIAAALLVNGVLLLVERLMFMGGGSGFLESPAGSRMHLHWYPMRVWIMQCADSLMFIGLAHALGVTDVFLLVAIGWYTVVQAVMFYEAELANLMMVSKGGPSGKSQASARVTMFWYGLASWAVSAITVLFHGISLFLSGASMFYTIVLSAAIVAYGLYALQPLGMALHMWGGQCTDPNTYELWFRWARAFYMLVSSWLFVIGVLTMV